MSHLGFFLFFLVGAGKVLAVDKYTGNQIYFLFTKVMYCVADNGS